jgi:hypothetical protein
MTPGGAAIREHGQPNLEHHSVSDWWQIEIILEPSNSLTDKLA